MKLVRGTISVDLEQGTVTFEGGGSLQSHPLGSAEGFELVSRAWLRAGWDAKHVYGFSWMGRPIIQLPDDMVRIQEVIYAVRPNVVIETGVAHGGSLIFYASLLKAMDVPGARVVGVDIEIRPHNRAAIEAHELSSMLRLVEGSSVDPAIVRAVANQLEPGDRTLVMLDSNHLRDHVLAELEAYAPLVSPGSYMVATDGIMRDLPGAPRSAPGWGDDNPVAAADRFLAAHPEFERVEPAWPFNEGTVRDRVTYWPAAYLRRRD